MFLSFLVTCHNEVESLDNLLLLLIKYKKENQEIVVLDDFSTNEKTKEIFIKYKDNVVVYTHSLNLNYGEHKNYGKSLCKGKWIFQLDADELPSELLLKNIEIIINANESNDVIWVPRLNYIDGITESEIKTWRCRISKFDELKLTKIFKVDDPYYSCLKQYNYVISSKSIDKLMDEVVFNKIFINYPDVQGRIYKNTDYIKYIGKLHERVIGYRLYTIVENNPSLALQHDKTIETQRKTNDYYKQMFSLEENQGYALSP